MQIAVELALRESGIESLAMKHQSIDVSLESMYTDNGRRDSYSVFEIDSDNIKQSGKIIRDELLRRLE